MTEGQGNGLGTATLKTRLDLSGLNQDITQAKTDIKGFANSTKRDFTDVEKSVNSLGDATGLEELKTQMREVTERAETLKKKTKELGDANDDAQKKTDRLAGAVKFLAGAYVVLESAKTVVTFLKNSAEAAEEADSSYRSYTTSTNFLTASQDNLEAAVGRRVTPALATLNIVFGSTLDLVADMIGKTDTVSANTAVMGNNFTTAANDGISLTEEMLNIATGAAIITTRLQGVGQGSIALIKVITAPFAALGNYVGTTLAQLELSVTAIKSLTQLDFAGFNTANAAILEIERTKVSNAQDTLVNGITEGLEGLAAGFDKVFNAESNSIALRDSIIRGMEEALELSQYGTTLEADTASSISKGAVKGLESKEVSDAVSMVIAPIAAVTLPSISLTSSPRGIINPTIQARDSIPQAPAITQPTLNNFGGNPTSGLAIPAVSPFSPVELVEAIIEPVTRLALGDIQNSSRLPNPVPLDLPRNVMPETPVEQDLQRDAISQNFVRDLSLAIEPLVTVSKQLSVVPFTLGDRGGVSVSTRSGIDVTPNIGISNPFRAGVGRSQRLTGQASINDQSARAQLQASLEAAPAATEARIKSEEAAAIVQARSAENFALTVVNAGAQFGNAILSFAQGNIGSGIGQLGQGVGSIVGAVNPIAGAAIGVGSGLLGGFIDLFTGQDEKRQAAERANATRSVPAVTIVTNINQTNNASFSGISDPSFKANANNQIDQILSGMEAITTRVQNLEAGAE